MEDERDAEDAIRALDRIEFGRKGRRLRVEWTKQERSTRRPESSNKSSSSTRPSKTLFVINFDPYHTRTRDLERHFDPYGKILNIRVRRNFAFIQFESLEDATKALNATNMSKLLDRVITVEFAIKDDDDRRSGNSPDRVRDRSPRKGYDSRARSQSPYRRERDSPDYGHSRGRSPSPYRRERPSPTYARGRSQSPNKKERGSPNRKDRHPRRDRELSTSPRKEEGEADYNHEHISSPQPKRSNGDISNGLNSRKSASPEDGQALSISPKRKSASPEDGQALSISPKREERETANTDDYARDRTPAYSDGESPPPERYGSQSTVARERS